jgi:hypothetical protein
MKCNSRVIESKLFPELWFKKWYKTVFGA